MTDFYLHAIYSINCNEENINFSLNIYASFPTKVMVKPLCQKPKTFGIHTIIYGDTKNLETIFLHGKEEQTFCKTKEVLCYQTPTGSMLKLGLQITFLLIRISELDRV